MIDARSIRRFVLGALSVAVAFLATVGCHPKVNYNQPLPPGAKALRKILPEEYPDFTANAADLPNLARSIDCSIKYLSAKSSRQFFPYLDITHERAVASLYAFRDVVTKQLQRGGGGGSISFNDDIRQNFEVYQSIGAPDPESSGYTSKVLFTGYCTPIYNASLTRGGAYQYPLYKRPLDLVADRSSGVVQGRKLSDGRVVPYYTRGEIERGQVLAGQELVWLTSRWETYVVTIQGSARLRLTDGRLYEIGFDGYNGYDYVSPGAQMVADGVLPPEQHTSKGMRAYFDEHPADMDKYLSLNKRYIFFTERTGGPFGCLNVPVTPMASIATDKSIYPRSMPAFLMVPVPVNEDGQTTDYRGFMMDQDAGGGIRASGRCDIYMGVGPHAERLAGQQVHEGLLYYIAVKPDQVGKYLPKQISTDARRPNQPQK